MPSPPEASTTSDSPHIRCSADRATARLTKVTTREDGRADDEAPHGQDHPRVHQSSGRIRSGRVREHSRHVHGQRRRGSTPLAQGLRLGLADSRIRDASRRHAHAVAANRSRARSAAVRRRSVDSSADHFGPASISPRSARTPSPWTVMSSRPTAVPAPRQ